MSTKKKNKPDKNDLFDLPGEVPSSGNGKSRKKKKKKKKGGFRAFIICLLVVLCLAMAARYLVIDSVKIRSCSVSDYVPGDIVLINLLADTSSLTRGSIVYVRAGGSSDACLRRVTAFPGDRITTGEDGRLVVFADDTAEPLPIGSCSAVPDGVIPEGKLLVLSDDGSADSGVWGLVDLKDVCGIPFLRF